jgi:hypothetical protein
MMARPGDGKRSGGEDRERTARSARGGCWLAFETGEVDDARHVPERGNEA